MIRKLLLFFAAIALVPAPAMADTLVDNINGISIDREGKVTRFAALVFDENGRIVQILQMGDPLPRTEYRVDGEGRVMVPGFIDAHGHVMGLGMGLMVLDLSGTTSLEDALATIAAYAEANPGRAWIIGRGWNQEKWGLGRYPTAADLDAVVGDRPVWLERVDGHAGWANSSALEIAGVTASTTSPEGGRIERIAGSKAPEGVLVDAAMPLVADKVPAWRADERDVALAKAQDLLVSQGITAIADMGTSVEDWMTFRRAGDDGRLVVRIMAYATGVPEMVLIGGTGPTRWLYDDRLRLNGVKLYLDGALGSRGALLLEDYEDAPGQRGLPLIGGTDLRNFMSRAAMDGYQVAIHAIGTAANREALDAIEELGATYTTEQRWRIEHAQIVHPDDIVRFGELGVIASVQPVHQTSDRLMAEARLGPDRLTGAYAWRSLAAAGAPLAFGSDVPVEFPDVIDGLAVAISRTDKSGEPFGGWRPEETVSREQALAGFTAGAAWAGYGDGRFGRLVVGERADFVFLSDDPLMASVTDTREIAVLETWIGGVKVYDANGDGAGEDAMADDGR
ncbi:amidohydrolase [Paraurantiacibacter namhicola]|uniref:N-substituted formamide deformylase n=1 Tax=Paraurantiacibacter namhicola TaxID=645517 RepID=A0A1C7DB88_9SPHN|nr:amidohydrolase [Paraurantiacibacter namhicola]ANU08581.1 N-substituted formamide deformylase precursor [Paraurantiacibacter namhicola]